MQEHTFDTWEQFTDELDRLYRDHASKHILGANISSLLFRGHGDSSWQLETTLERTKRPDQFSLIEYYRTILRIQPRLETLAGMKWKNPTVSDYAAWAKTLKPVSEGELLAVPYLAFLRHHGFPSPLLDWTRSPYVAAFFAFRQLVKGATHISIYTYLEWANSHKSATAMQPEIRGVGPRFPVHKRHIMQQSEYTVCILHGEDACYARHQDVFDRTAVDQDILLKFNIPVSERIKVLTQLSRMNINAYSLFGSDDSLLEEMTTTEFILR